MSGPRPDFLEGVVVALVASLAGGAILHPARLVLGAPGALATTLAILGPAYVLYLLHRADEPAGRITLLSVTLLATVCSLVLAPGLVLPVQLAAIWLTRSLYLQPGLLGAAADLGLVGLGLGGGLWALSSTGSLAVALWTFFLVQALFPAVASGLRSCAGPDPDAEERFARAERRATALLRRLRRRE